MGAFEEHKLRDRGYRERFQQKLEEIRHVRKTHSFIAYATNRQLIEELEQIYAENLESYESCYVWNQEAFMALTDKFEAVSDGIHKARATELKQQFPRIEALLSAEDYNLNAESKKLIEECSEKLESWQQEFEGWQEDLRAYRMRLKVLMNEVWAEQFEAYKRAYQHRKGEVMGTQLPTEPVRLAEPAITAAIQARKEEVARLLTKASKTPRFMAAAQAFEDSYASYEAFQELEKEIDQALRARSRTRWFAMAVAILLIGVGAYYGPGLYRTYNEDNYWQKSKTENTYSAYRKYIETYPEGRHVIKARNAQLLLDSGSIPDFEDSKGDVFAYEGALEQGMPEGKGIAEYANGDRYEGEWQGGIRSGLGKLVYANGDVYEGLWEFGKAEGKGTCVYANGNQYTGDWKAGLFHGRGTMNYEDGSFYDGQWKKGKMEGQGTFQSAENLKYAGRWKAGKRHGQGTQDYADGSTYVGKWEGDQRSGLGTIYMPDRSQFAGQWKQDRINGYGTFTSKLRESFTGTFEGKPEEITLKDATGRVIRQGKWEGGLFLER